MKVKIKIILVSWIISMVVGIPIMVMAFHTTNETQNSFNSLIFDFQSDQNDLIEAQSHFVKVMENTFSYILFPKITDPNEVIEHIHQLQNSAYSFHSRSQNEVDIRQTNLSNNIMAYSDKIEKSSLEIIKLVSNLHELNMELEKIEKKVMMIQKEDVDYNNIFLKKQLFFHLLESISRIHLTGSEQEFNEFSEVKKKISSASWSSVEQELINELVLKTDQIIEEEIKLIQKISDFRIFGDKFEELLSKSNDEITYELDLAKTLVKNSISTSMQITIVTIIIMMSISVLIGGVLSQKILRPLEKLTGMIEKVDEGNLQINSKAFDDDEFGILSKTFSTMLDSIKKSTDLEEQLAIQSNLKRALDESSMVAITNNEGIIKFVNDKFCEVTEFSSDELIGKTHEIIRSGHQTPQFYEDLWKKIRSGKVWRGEVRNKSKSGRIFWTDLVIVPFLDKAGNVTEHVAIRRDISEKKKLTMEKIRNEKMLTVGNLSARLAHDMRNPLAIIQMSLENLKLKYKDEDQKFEKINKSIMRISHQINDVLNFVKTQPIKPMKTKISQIISESLESLSLSNKIKLNLPENDFDITCDKEQLGIAINNILLNSIQAIDNSGTITIRIQDTIDAVKIEIEDSGSGMDTEILEKIFDPLFTTKQKGTGLGLVSVKAIIDAHQGSISVSSPPTIFKIILPKIFD